MGNSTRPRTLDDILRRLFGVKQHGSYFSADCPAPGHRTPADHLTVKDAGDKALVTCQGGRHMYADICVALGFESLSYSVNGSKPEPVTTTRLNDREAMAELQRIYGLTDATIAHLGI